MREASCKLCNWAYSIDCLDREDDQACENFMPMSEWGYRFGSLFSGIGAPEKALDDLGVGYALQYFSEIDPSAARSYCAIHETDESLNIGDITKVDAAGLPKDLDFITYGFPCQDVSLEGKKTGLFNKDGSRTRSGLFFDALRIIEETRPKVAIAENVKNLTGKTFRPQFEIILKSLEEAGYNNYWAVLDARNHGIPQRRERVFIVSIRKDIDTGRFSFPKGYPLKLKLADLLEDLDDEEECKYIFSQDLMDKMITITGFVAKVKQATKKGYIEALPGDSINLEQPNSKTRRGRVGKEVAQTLTTSPQQGVYVLHKDLSGIIRRFTPRECWRLMGFQDADFDKAAELNNSTQLYKQAGNSIVVPVLEDIFKAIFDAGIFEEAR